MPVFVDRQRGMLKRFGIAVNHQLTHAAAGRMHILFSAVLIVGHDTTAQAGEYASAFVAGMLYNLGRPS